MLTVYIPWLPLYNVCMATHHVLQSFIKLVPAATILPSVAEQAVSDNIIL